MGGKIVVPEPDANIRRVVKNFQFSPKDISDFWKLFQKLDKEKSGLVPLALIFKSFEMERNLLTDCLLELLDIEHEGEINFSDFLLMVVTYCFFEPSEILKFCFFCFDQDKAGFFSIDDLNNLMNVVHNIKTGSTVKGTVKGSWMRLTFKEDQINFEEFVRIHTAFPRLFEPAFRLQQLMMIHTMGEVWWTFKKRHLQDVKEEALAKEARALAKREKKKQAKKNKKIQRNMGLVKYYLCPCYRGDYDPSRTAYDKLSQKEKEEWDKQAALARREADLKLKTPETAIWLKYEQKLARLAEGGEDENEEEEKKDSGSGAIRPKPGEARRGSKQEPSSMALVVAPGQAVAVAGPAGGGQAVDVSRLNLTSHNGKMPVVTSGQCDDDVLAMEDGDEDLDLGLHRDSAIGAKPAKKKKKTYLDEKLQSTQRPREDRATTREERRKQRKMAMHDV